MLTPIQCPFCSHWSEVPEQFHQGRVVCAQCGRSHVLEPLQLNRPEPGRTSRIFSAGVVLTVQLGLVAVLAGALVYLLLGQQRNERRWQKERFDLKAEVDRADQSLKRAEQAYRVAQQSTEELLKKEVEHNDTLRAQILRLEKELDRLNGIRTYEVRLIRIEGAGALETLIQVRGGLDKARATAERHYPGYQVDSIKELGK